jgi:hypothetical protein
MLPDTMDHRCRFVETPEDDFLAEADRAANSNVFTGRRSSQRGSTREPVAALVEQAVCQPSREAQARPHAVLVGRNMRLNRLNIAL